MSADKTELRGLVSTDLAAALDAIAMARGMTRHDYVVQVLDAEVKKVPHEASVLCRVLRGNPYSRSVTEPLRHLLRGFTGEACYPKCRRKKTTLSSAGRPRRGSLETGSIVTQERSDLDEEFDHEFFDEARTNPHVSSLCLALDELARAVEQGRKPCAHVANQVVLARAAVDVMAVQSIGWFPSKQPTTNV